MTDPRHFKKIFLFSLSLIILPLAVYADDPVAAVTTNTVTEALPIPLPVMPKDTYNAELDMTKYTLGPEDVISITVNNHPEFDGTFQISLEGKIQYAFLGDVNVTGLTKPQLEEKIQEIVSKYVKSPKVHVIITEFKSKSFFVLGEVLHPGKFNMRSESISVKEAVIMAGLPTPAAAMRKSKITTPGANGASTSKEVDLYSLLYSGELSENITLKPGDTLFVPAAVTESVDNRKKTDNNLDALKYTLGPEDVIEINVMQRPDFSGTYTISQEGKIQYKFVGDINVKGMTKGELEEKIRKMLSAYISSPDVNVTIMEFKSKFFYVVGEVNIPGKHFMRSEDITVNEAIMMANLPTSAAALRKAQIITPGLQGSHIRKVNLYSLLYKGDLKENILIKPGDYLYVPSTVMAKVIRMVSPVSTTVGLTSGSADDASTGKRATSAIATK